MPVHIEALYSAAPAAHALHDGRAIGVPVVTNRADYTSAGGGRAARGAFLHVAGAGPLFARSAPDHPLSSI